MWPKPPVLLVHVGCSWQFSLALLPTALGVSFLPPLSHFWLLLTSVPIIKKSVLNHSLEMLSHISYLSMAAELPPLLICTELPCRKQLSFQPCANGEFRQRTGESSDIPSNLSPTKVCFEKATAQWGTAVNFSSAFTSWFRVECWWAFIKSQAMASWPDYHIQPSWSFCLVLKSTFQLPLALTPCCPHPYLATFFFLSSLFPPFFCFIYFTI